jgi:hypothetical protein
VQELGAPFTPVWQATTMERSQTAKAEVEANSAMANGRRRWNTRGLPRMVDGWMIDR